MTHKRVVLAKISSFSEKTFPFLLPEALNPCFCWLLGLNDSSAKGWKKMFVHPPFPLFFLPCWNSHFHENWNQEGQSGQIDQNCAINCWIPGNASNKSTTKSKIEWIYLKNPIRWFARYRILDFISIRRLCMHLHFLYQCKAVWVLVMF